MKYKRGGIAFVAGIILAILLVGSVAYISLHSMGISITGIFEEGKRLVGTEAKKAEAPPTKTEGCVVKRYYWSQDKAKAGQNINIITEGNINCDGKSIKISIYEDRFFLIGDKLQESLNGQFKEGKINIKWKSDNKGTFYFIPEFENNRLEKSNAIEII